MQELAQEQDRPRLRPSLPRVKRVIYPVAVLITAPGHIIQPAATPY